MPEPKPHVNFAAVKAGTTVGSVKPDPMEQIKLSKDGLDIIHDIYRYAKLGFEAIKPADLALFKWYGVYTQRPESEGYFMMRLKVPGGQVTSAQAKVIADIADE